MTAQRTRYGREIDAALTLLRTGRTAMAVRVLEGLTELVTGEMLEAMARAYDDGRRNLAAEITGTAKPKRPRAPQGAALPARRDLPWATVRRPARPDRRPARRAGAPGGNPITSLQPSESKPVLAFFLANLPTFRVLRCHVSR
jgi:hypothetical protein